MIDEDPNAPHAIARVDVLLPSTELRDLADKAQAIFDTEGSENTRRAYASAWVAFESWCIAHSLQTLPTEPTSVVLYLTSCDARGLKVGTIQSHLAAISDRHQRDGHPRPSDERMLREFMRKLRRARGVRAETKKTPFGPASLAAALCTLDLTTLRGLRDRALLLLGIAMGPRRSELAALDVANLTAVDDGLVVLIARSKTDQEGQGYTIGVPRNGLLLACPVAAVRDWRAATGIDTGALFRGIDRHGRLLDERLSDKGVARAMKDAAERAGLDPALFSGHSLRSGFATTAAGAGVGVKGIMRHTRHRSEAMVNEYIHLGTLFVDNPGRLVLDAVARAVLARE